MYYFCLHKLHGCWKSCKWVSLNKTTIKKNIYLKDDNMYNQVVFDKYKI
jgi:hypothetical protein